MFIVPNTATLPQEVEDKVIEMVQSGYLRVVPARVLFVTPEAKVLLAPPERPLSSQLDEFNNFYDAIKALENG